jgi:hypothetical protein
VSDREHEKGGALTAAKAVFWSFFGVRKRSDWQSDTVKLKPAQVVLAGLLGGAIFLATILGLVFLVMHLAGAD